MAERRESRKLREVDIPPRTGAPPSHALSGGDGSGDEIAREALVRLSHLSFLSLLSSPDAFDIAQSRCSFRYSTSKSSKAISRHL